jgi:hypothetical protein
MRPRRSPGLVGAAALCVGLAALGSRTDRIEGAARWQELPAEPPVLRPIRGQLRVHGLSYADDNGPGTWAFAHFMEAFSAYVRDPAAVRAELDSIKTAGYAGIRFLDVLGYWDAAWAGKEITPIAFRNNSGHTVQPTADYYAQLGAFLRDVDARALKVHHSRGDLNSWSLDDKREHVRRVAEVYRRVGPHVVALKEVVNEAWQNGLTSPDEAADLLGIFKAVHPQVLGGLSCPPEASEAIEDLRAWSRDPADVVIVHAWRGGTDEAKTRQVWTVAAADGRNALGKPIWHGEPPGPGEGVTVGRIEDEESLALIAATALSTGQHWTYMSGCGVFWTCPLASQAGFAAVARIPSLLPRDVGQYEVIVDGAHPEAWLTSATGFQGSGPARVDNTISPSRGRLVATVRGGTPPYGVRARVALRGYVIDPTQRAPAYEFRLSPGGVMRLEYDKGRLIVAERIP